MLVVVIALDLVDPGAFIGVAGLLLTPLTLIVTGFAVYKVQDAARWKIAEQASREGMDIANIRLAKANEWNVEVEKRLVQRETQYEEQKKLCEALEHRLRVQDERVAKLLERTPEALWQAVEKHAAEAEKHWRFEREILNRIEAIHKAVVEPDYS